MDDDITDLNANVDLSPVSGDFQEQVPSDETSSPSLNSPDLSTLIQAILGLAAMVQVPPVEDLGPLRVSCVILSVVIGACCVAGVIVSDTCTVGERLFLSLCVVVLVYTTTMIIWQLLTGDHDTISSSMYDAKKFDKRSIIVGLGYLSSQGVAFSFSSLDEPFLISANTDRLLSVLSMAMCFSLFALTVSPGGKSYRDEHNLGSRSDSHDRAHLIFTLICMVLGLLIQLIFVSNVSDRTHMYIISSAIALAVSFILLLILTPRCTGMRNCHMFVLEMLSLLFSVGPSWYISIVLNSNFQCVLVS
jgi:hypothetical protein